MSPVRLLRRILRPARGGIERVLRSSSERLLLRRSQDATQCHAARSCLVVAPHADDEALGCGGSILLRRAAGQRVSVVWLTDGRYSQVSEVVSPEELARLREDEARRVADLLQVPAGDLHFLGVEDGTAEAHMPELTVRVRVLLEALRPDDVLVTSRFDGHPDHVAAERVVRAAVDGLATPPRVLTYPVWSWYGWPWIALDDACRPGGRGSAVRAWLRAPVDAPRAVRSEHIDVRAHVRRKAEALALYRSQFQNLTGEPTWTFFGSDFAPRFLTGREWFFSRS